MKHWLILSLASLGIVAGPSSASEAGNLVKALKKAAQPGTGITELEQQAAQKVQDFGSDAIPFLLGLLHDNDADVRDLASFTLRDMRGLTEQHLDALIAASKSGEGWIPVAIARVGTPKAVTFLVEELMREREMHTQVTGAIAVLGGKAVPELLRRIYQEDPQWEAGLENTMLSVFSDLGDKAVAAIDPLLQMANDASIPQKSRIRAISTLGAIGPPAERAVPQLQQLLTAGDENIKHAASWAVVNIGSDEAVPILVEWLQDATDSRDKARLIHNIAELKTQGRSAGPAVTKHLTDSDWDVRVAGARALGHIDHKESADVLIPLLARVDDWRLAFTAAESLGRLKSKQALPALEQAVKDHWYPPVRQAAQSAAKAIRDGAVPESGHHSSNFLLELFGYERAGADMEALQATDAEHLRFALDPAQNQPLTVAIRGKDGKVTRQQVRGLEVGVGYLVGTDSGEWGGEISFIDPQGGPSVLMHKNTEAIYQTAAGIVAVTGLAHLMMNDGFLYRITQDANGQWTTAKWRALPGAPIFSKLLADGRLLISCHGGIVLVSPNGALTSLTCDEALRPPAPSGK